MASSTKSWRSGVKWTAWRSRCAASAGKTRTPSASSPSPASARSPPARSWRARQTWEIFVRAEILQPGWASCPGRVRAEARNASEGSPRWGRSLDPATARDGRLVGDPLATPRSGLCRELAGQDHRPKARQARSCGAGQQSGQNRMGPADARRGLSSRLEQPPPFLRQGGGSPRCTGADEGDDATVDRRDRDTQPTPKRFSSASA